MPLKQPETLTREDFADAVVMLRMGLAELAKETGVPRTYLSEFRNGDRKLRPEILAKLRDYFEGKGVEFDTAPEPDEAPPPEPATPHPRIAAGTIMYLPVRVDLSEDRIGAVMKEIARNDTRATVLCNKRAARDDGEFSSGTQDELRELFALFAANYVFVRYLTGADNPFAAPPAKNTLLEIMLDAVSESTERAGVVPQEEPEEVES